MKRATGITQGELLQPSSHKLIRHSPTRNVLGIPRSLAQNIKDKLGISGNMKTVDELSTHAMTPELSLFHQFNTGSKQPHRILTIANQTLLGTPQNNRKKSDPQYAPNQTWHSPFHPRDRKMDSQNEQKLFVVASRGGKRNPNLESNPEHKQLLINKYKEKAVELLTNNPGNPKQIGEVFKGLLDDLNEEYPAYKDLFHVMKHMATALEYEDILTFICCLQQRFWGIWEKLFRQKTFCAFPFESTQAQ